LSQIVNQINNKAAFIVNNISSETLAVYFLLVSQFATSNVTQNHLFQSTFRSYYRVNNMSINYCYSAFLVPPLANVLEYGIFFCKEPDLRLQAEGSLKPAADGL
jgi:hypothetical protein